jgi:hypothetical protein
MRYPLQYFSFQAIVFIHWLKKLTGLTPYEYLRHIKLRRAALKQTLTDCRNIGMQWYG